MEAQEEVKHCLNKELYKIKMSVDAKVEGGLDRLLETISDDFIHDAAICIGRRKRIGENKFASSFEWGRNRKFTIPYIRAIAFFRVLDEQPELADSLESTSSYMPHNLFRVKKPKNSTNRDIALAIQEATDDDLAGLVSKIRGYVVRLKSGLRRTKMGKYSLPLSSKYVFAHASNPEEEANLTICTVRLT